MNVTRAIARNIVILTACLLVVFIFVRELSRLYVLSEENERIRFKVSQLEAENAALREKIRLLESDESYIEQAVRRELGMIRDNEKVYRFKK